MKRIVLFSVVILIIFGSIIGYNALADVVPDRVLIGLRYGSTAVSTATVTANGYYIKSDSDEAFYQTISQSPIEVKPGQYGNIDIYQDGECIVTYAYDLVIYPMLGNLIYDGKTYRGGMQFKRDGNDITVINRLSMNEYLYAVLPREMGGNAPIEALKAQAVCARNYTAKNVKRHASQGFNLCATEHCQVYGDMSVETAAARQAVDETTGIVARYNGSIAELFYFASDGGFTEDVANVWGSTGYPYLAGVEDPYETDKATHHTWSVTFTKDEMTRIFGSDVGTVTDVNILSTSENGAVTKLEVVGTNGSKTFVKEKCRTVFGGKIYSQAYTITKNYADGTSVVLGLDDTSSQKLADVVYVEDGDGNVTQQSLYALQVVTADGTQEVPKPYGEVLSYTLNGRGYGHLIGMSQWGAMAMAEQGYTYEQILTHYFTGITLGN